MNTKGISNTGQLANLTNPYIFYQYRSLSMFHKEKILHLTDNNSANKYEHVKFIRFCRCISVVPELLYFVIQVFYELSSAFIQLWHFPTAKYLIHDWQGLRLTIIAVPCKHCTMIILLNTSHYIRYKCKGIILVIKHLIQVLHIAPIPISPWQKVIDFPCPSDLWCNAMHITKLNDINVACMVAIRCRVQACGIIYCIGQCI